MATAGDALQSSQSFVRALKSATDPPYKNGPSKIQIARHGWESQSLYVPRKSDLILEWIFTRFQKEKSRQIQDNPLVDVAHWTLLADILAHPSDTQIVPLISRTSIPVLLTSFITLYPSLPTVSRTPILTTLLRSLNVLWPLAVRRAGIDPLSECLWGCLPLVELLRHDSGNDVMADILTLVFTAFRSAFENANVAGKKKAQLTFVQHHLHSWLRAMHFLLSTHPLHTHLYSLGTDILFNPDYLRTSLDTNPHANSGTGLFSALFRPPSPIDEQARSALLNLLPYLCRGFVAALRKHRSSIFSSASAGQQSRERLQRAAIQLGCESLVFLKNLQSDVDVLESLWKARVGVLRVIEEEVILDHVDGSEAMDEVKIVVKDAVIVLDRAWEGSQSQLVAQALDALACLHRIEPDIVAPFVPQILERLAVCSPGGSTHALTFLSQLTSYHSKTRTLHTLICHLISALSSSLPFVPSLDAYKTFALCTSSPLLSLSFADELSNALRAFMTPGQADEAVTSIKESLETWRPSLEISDERARKRRRLSAGEDEGLHPHNEGGLNSSDAVRFALVARLSSTSLGAIFQGASRGDASEKRRSCLKAIDNLILGALECILDAENTGDTKLSKKEKSKGKRARHEDESSRWARHCSCASLLRLWYDLFVRSGAPGISTLDDERFGVPKVLDRIHSMLVSLMRQEDVLPELQLEVGRILYARGTRQEEGNRNDSGWVAFDTILDYVETANFSDDAGSTKTDPEHSPTSSRRASALALWSLTLERYLPTIDVLASQAQLDRLSHLMVRSQSSTSLPQDEQLSGASVLTRALASASFWELDNIRTSMLATLDKQTAGLGSIPTIKCLSAMIGGDSKAINVLQKSSSISLNHLEAGVQVYHLLHSFPPEYLSKASRAELAKRALAADVFVCATSSAEKPHRHGLVEWQAVFRSFIVIAAGQAHTKTVDEMAVVTDWVAYLTRSKYAPALPTETFNKSTTDLLSLVFMSAMRAAINSDGAALINVLSHFVQSNPFVGNALVSEPLAQQSLLRFVGMLVSDFKASSFSENVLRHVRRMCQGLDDTLKSVFGTAVGTMTVSEFLTTGPIIEAWQVLLSLKQWLQIENESEEFGEKLLARTIRIISVEPTETASVSDDFRARVLALLVEQGQKLPATECRHVDTILPAYIFLIKSEQQVVQSSAYCGNLKSSSARLASACDTPMSRAIRSFSVKQFETALEIVADALENGSDDLFELTSLMRLSTLLLREAPERTSKHSHEHLARCLRIFVNRPAFTKGLSTLSALILDFIDYQCAERAASLRTSDVACIWLILSRLLTGGPEHYEHTSAATFQAIVSIVNALVRLRRDLLGPHMPHLSMMLRQLIMVIRTVRPHLGAKQHRLVSDTLPEWINPSYPLGEAEARSLARLLTALNTKSLVRSHNSNDAQKAESLARPFARHAPYVLLAYVQLMNDPLSVLSITMRRELEPGLFALCGMMGEHGRDTLMVQSLDVGGKALLKTLWKDYDKQRYIGRG